MIDVVAFGVGVVVDVIVIIVFDVGVIVDIVVIFVFDVIVVIVFVESCEKEKKGDLNWVFYKKFFLKKGIHKSQ